MKRQTAETRNNRMEDISFQSRILCDRCGKKRPEGSNGLGWLTGMMSADGKWDWHGFDARAREVDICPDCFQSEEEANRAEHQVSQYIHFSLFRRSSLLRDINSRFLSDRKSFLVDCGNVSRLLKTYRRRRIQKFYKSYYGGKSMALSEEVSTFLRVFGKPISNDGMKCVLENSDGQVLFIDGEFRRVFVAKGRDDFIALYWLARNTARLHTRRTLRFNLKDIPGEQSANSWKAVARYARQRIKQLSLPNSPAEDRHIVFTRVPSNPAGTIVTP